MSKAEEFAYSKYPKEKEGVSDDLEKVASEKYLIRPYASYKEGFKDGANWQKEQILQKALEWLDGVIYDYLDTGSIGDFEILRGVNNEKFIKDFKNAMEE